MDKKWITTEHPAIIFEENTFGRLKKQIWDASEEEIDSILKEYEIPSPSELGKAADLVHDIVETMDYLAPILRS